MTGIEEEIAKMAYMDHTWCRAIISVMNDPKNKETIIKAANSVNMPLNVFITQISVALYKPTEIFMKIFTDAGYSAHQAAGYARKAQRINLVQILQATVGIGSAGVASVGTMGLAAIKGTAIALLEGLALVGVLALTVVAVYYGATYLGELSADKPIEPVQNWPTHVDSNQEKSTAPATYGRLIASKNGVDVTNERTDKPLYLYYDKYDGYFLEYTSIIKHNEPLFIDGRVVAGLDKTLGVIIPDEYPIGGPYTTYGGVCESMEKKLKEDGDYNIATGFFCYKNGQFLCKREVLTGMEVDPFGVPVRLEDFLRGHRP